MKKIKVFIVSVSCCLFLTDCEKQLDLAPLGELNDQTYYQTEEHFDGASLSVYNTLLNFNWEAYTGWGKMGGILMPDDDMMPSNNSSNDEEDFNWNPSNKQFSFVWAELYKGVQRANVIIDALPKAQGFKDDSRKARYEAEAKFLRAYFNFHLALNWGTPPVIESAVRDYEGTLVANSQPGEIWDIIISDLSFAKENLPEVYDDANVGRVTKGAANALLGKVYLFRAQMEGNTGDYTNAVNALNEVVNSGQYSLVENYGDNFSIEHENNPESVFEVQISNVGSANNNQWLPNDFGTPGNQDVGSVMSGRLAFIRPACGPTGVCAPRNGDAGIGKVATSPSLMDAIEENDPRRPHIFFLEGDPYDLGENVTFDAEWSVSGSTPSKYLVESSPVGFPSISDYNNDRIIRYSDVLLMLAEAKLLGSGDVAGAAELVNQVRERADPGQEILEPRSSGASVEEMFAWIMHERRIELAFEGWRYYDLVRWHEAGLIDIAIDVDFGREPANAAWSPTYLLKPIPQSDLDVNPNLSQNTGY